MMKEDYMSLKPPYIPHFKPTAFGLKSVQKEYILQM